MDVSRFPEVDAHVFKAQYFEALEHAEQQRQLKEGLDRQVKLKAEMERRRKDEERATERRIAREVAERWPLLMSVRRSESVTVYRRVIFPAGKLRTSSASWS